MIFNVVLSVVFRYYFRMRSVNVSNSLTIDIHKEYSDLLCENYITRYVIKYSYIIIISINFTNI